jgi:hypothetical protein
MTEQKHFDVLVSDHDTALFRAAKFVQEDYVIISHYSFDSPMELRNKTEFWGHHGKKEGGWLGEHNAEREENELPPYPPEEFEIESLCRLLPEIEDHMEEAERNFDISVGALKKTELADDYLLIIGGGDNFRYDIAQELPYKGERKEKPILFAKLRKRVIKKYRSRMVVTRGTEADDEMSKLGKENYLHYKDTGEWKYLLSYIDKDLKMIMSPHINPDKLEEGVQFNSPLEAARCYASQLLTGDKSVDNIPGLPDVSTELREKYGVRKAKGVGKATADGLLASCETPKELFERVCEAYKDHYGEDDTYAFTNFRDEHLEWTWKDFLKGRASLLWMYRDDSKEYDIFEDTFKKLKVRH